MSAQEQRSTAEEASVTGSCLDDCCRGLQVIGEGGIGRVYRADRQEGRKPAPSIGRVIRRD